MEHCSKPRKALHQVCELPYRETHTAKAFSWAYTHGFKGPIIGHPQAYTQACTQTAQTLIAG